jgi:hypothetical protein
VADPNLIPVFDQRYFRGSVNFSEYKPAITVNELTDPPDDRDEDR